MRKKINIYSRKRRIDRRYIIVALAVILSAYFIFLFPKNDEASSWQDERIHTNTEISIEKNIPSLPVEKISLSKETNAPQTSVVSEEINIENTFVYTNEAVGYGFRIPSYMYYRGFGPRNNAVHSVAISVDGFPETFDSGVIRIWFFKNTKILADNIKEEMLKNSGEIETLPLGDHLMVIWNDSEYKNISSLIKNTAFLTSNE